MQPATERQDFDQNRAEVFGEQLMDMLNKSAMSVMTSIGHRTGLFDAMSQLPPSTSQEIADAAQLNERYVREWLGAMTTARFVDYDPDSRRYRLPAEHAAFLTRAAAPNNVAVYAQYTGLIGGIEDAIIECFHRGGGVPYSRFRRFHEVMAEDSGQTVLPVLREHILPLVPGLTERLAAGIRVLDLGCGRGRALMLLAGWYPNSRFVGLDLSEEAIDFARAEAQRQGLDNLDFVVQDATRFDVEAEPGAFDLVTTFDAIHDQADPAAVLRGIHRSLAPDGVYLAQDINASRHLHQNLDHPLGPFLYTVSTTHCMTVSLAQGGAGLGTVWGRETAVEMLEAAGFREVEVHELPHDFQNCYYVSRP